MDEPDEDDQYRSVTRLEYGEEMDEEEDTGIFQPLQIDGEESEDAIHRNGPSVVRDPQAYKTSTLFCFTVMLALVIVAYLTMDTDQNAGIIGVEAEDKLEKSDPGKNGGTNSEKFSVSLDDGVMFKVVGGILDHDRTHFTQGLTYSKHSDILFQSNGLKGKSSVCRLNATTGSSISCVDMEKQYFGEGIQVYGKPGEEKLIQITWTSHEGFIYDSETLDVIRKFTFSTTKNEGWGICYDEANNIFIVSDGSHYLHFWDGDTLEQKQRVAVTRMNGGQANKINELEFVNGKVLANIWYEDVIIVIDPLTGTVESEYDMTNLWPIHNRTYHANVLNGISISKDDGILYITGKQWDRMYRLKLLGFS